MALTSKTGVSGRNLALDACFDVLNSGKFRLYTTAQPSDSDSALGAQTLLADLALGSTAFAAASAGSKAANAITQDSSADATGTADWCTLTTSGAVRKYDGSAGTSGCNLNLNTVSIVSAAAVSVTSWTFTQAA